MKRLLPILCLLVATVANAQLVGPGGGSSGSGASTTQGIGGGATNTPGADSVVNVKNYGAFGNGVVRTDGAMAAMTTATSASGSGFTINTPSAVANGDLLIPLICSTQGTAFTPPAAFTLVDSGFPATTQLQGNIYTAVGSTSTSSYTMGTGTAFSTGLLLDIQNSTAAVDVFAHNSASTGTTITFPTVTTTQPNDLILHIMCGQHIFVQPPAEPQIQSFDDGVHYDAGISFTTKATAGATGTAVGTQAASGQWVAFTIAIKATSGSLVTAQPLTSAGATFTAADVGKRICVDAAQNKGAFTSPTDGCGTILTFTNATSIGISVPNDTGSAISSKEFLYASDDTTAIQAAINAITTSGTVWFPNGIYGVSAAFTFPVNTTVNLQGTGSAVNDWRNVITPTVLTNNPGTTLWCGTKANASPLLSYTGTLHVTSQAAHDNVSNMALKGGVGVNYDGCGGDGIDTVNWAHWTGDHLSIYGFTGVGWYEDALTNGNSNTDYTVDNRLMNSNVSLNGGNGIRLGGNTGSTFMFLETTLIENNRIESNWLNGVEVNGPAASEVIDDLNIFGNLIQWNNVSGTNPGWEVSFDTTVNGCLLTSNHIEVAGNTHEGGVNDGTSAVVTGCAIENNGFFADVTGLTALQLGNSATNVYQYGLVNNNIFGGSTWTTCISKLGSSHSTGIHNSCNNGPTDIRWEDGPISTNWSGSANAVVSNSAANVFPISGVGTPVATTSEGTVSVYSPVAAVARNLKCTLTNAAGAATVAGGTNYVLALRQNLASSALTCTITAAISTCADNTHTVAVSIGDQLDAIDTPTGTPTALIPHCSVELDY